MISFREFLNESATKENFTALKAFMRKQGFTSWEFEDDYNTLIIGFKDNKAAKKAYKASEDSDNEIGAYGSDIEIADNKITVKLYPKVVKLMNESARKIYPELYYLVYSDSLGKDKPKDLYDFVGYETEDDAAKLAQKYQEREERENDDEASYAMTPMKGSELIAQSPTQFKAMNESLQPKDFKIGEVVTFKEGSFDNKYITGTIKGFKDHEDKANGYLIIKGDNEKDYKLIWTAVRKI